jgi:hypothetical protein
MLAEAHGSQVAARPSRADLDTLIHAATRAPSPDNNQPWLFEQRPDGELLLLHDRSRALPSDVDDMFSMIALGAALENLCLAARQRGWRSIVRHPADFAADDDGREVVAAVRFVEGGQRDPLADCIEQRVTCRKPYRRHAVADDSLHQLEASIADSAHLQLHWLADRPRIRKLAWLVADADRIRFEYEPFHAELYRQLRFTPQEAETTRDGLDVRCLELPLGGAAMLSWLRHWPRMRRLNRLGLSRLMSFASALQVWRTGTMGLLTTADASHLGYLQAGRALQRVWLKATRLALAFHPLGSVPIFLSHRQRGAANALPPRHRHTVEGLAQRFDSLFPQAAGQGLVVLFRLGEAATASVRSLREQAVVQSSSRNPPVAVG